MDADRPNHNMNTLAGAAVAIASKQSRLAAVEFLFDRGCEPEMITQILAASPMPYGIVSEISRR